MRASSTFFPFLSYIVTTAGSDRSPHAPDSRGPSGARHNVHTSLRDTKPHAAVETVSATPARRSAARQLARRGTSRIELPESLHKIGIGFSSQRTSCVSRYIKSTLVTIVVAIGNLRPAILIENSETQKSPIIPAGPTPTPQLHLPQSGSKLPASKAPVSRSFDSRNQLSRRLRSILGARAPAGFYNHLSGPNKNKSRA